MGDQEGYCSSQGPEIGQRLFAAECTASVVAVLLVDPRAAVAKAKRVDKIKVTVRRPNDPDIRLLHFYAFLLPIRLER